MNIAELSKFRGGVSVDTINELTSASGVTIDSVLLKDSAVTAASGVTTPTITEAVSGSGVTVDGLLLRDAGVENAVKVQFTQQASDPTTPSAGESEFYVKTDGKAYLKNSDGVVTPVGGGNTIDRVTQNSHGFAVGNLVRVTANDTYTGATATGANEAEVAGMVYRVIGANEFELTTGGVVDGIAASGFVEGVIPAAGTMCFLNAATGTGAGLLTVTEPTTVSYISKPAYLVTASGASASGYFFNMRGTTVGGTNLYTTIPLNNGAATTIQSLAGDTTFPINSGGFIEGFVTIDTSTTDYIFTFKVEYTKTGSTTIRVTPSYGAGDVPPGLTITDSGANIQINWTSLAGFNSASARFSMQAANVGTTLPLQISPALISGAADIACTSGYGISFGNETLKNYDEGTWTPTVTAQTGSLTSVTSNTGKYTRIGNMVVAQIAFTISDKGTASGNLFATLPISASATGAVGSSHENALVGSSARCSIYENVARVGIVPPAALANGQAFVATISYFVS